MVPKVHEIGQRQGPHPSLGPLLSRVQADLQAATPGKLEASWAHPVHPDSSGGDFRTNSCLEPFTERKIS